MSKKILAENHKTCKDCQLGKPISDFYHIKLSSGRIGVYTQCKFCFNTMNNVHRRTQTGRIKAMYHKQRASCRKRNHLYPTYNKIELTEWLYDNGFYALWCQWNWSDYHVDFSPSVDRLEDSKSYSFDNIRLITWWENNNKRRRSVQQFKDGKLINTFGSIADATRHLQLNSRSIPKCLSGKQNTAGGFTWGIFKINILIYLHSIIIILNSHRGIIISSRYRNSDIGVKSMT